MDGIDKIALNAAPYNENLMMFNGAGNKLEIPKRSCCPPSEGTV